MAGSDAEGLRSLVAFYAAQSYSINTNNPLDVILPLFEPIATAFHGRHFEPILLADELHKRYDLIVSADLCAYWSRQLLERKLLRQVADSSTGSVLIWQQSAQPTTPDGAFASELATIVAEFRSFVTRRNELVPNDLSDDEIAAILRRGAVGSLFQRLYEQADLHTSEEQFLFARFLQYISTEKPSVAEALVKLRRSAIYCDLILHMQQPKKPPKNAQPVNVYFDSPLVMDLIGLSGKQRMAFARRLLEVFATLRFVPLINEEMILEIKSNIVGLLNRPPAERYGPTADAIRAREITADDVKATLDRLAAIVEAAGVSIDKSFPRHQTNSRIDDELERQLFSKLQSHYQFVEAAERDAATIRGVFGRRSSIAPTDIYSAKAFFMTGNDMVVAVANKFFKDNVGYSDTTFPVVVGRATIAALVDAVAGVQSAGSLSMAEMLISAADATEYNVEVFDRIEANLKKVAPAEAERLLAILSTSDFSAMAMDVVRGNPRNVSDQTVEKIVENVRQQFAEEAEKKVALTVGRLRREAAEERASFEASIAKRDRAIEDAIVVLAAQHEFAKGRLLEMYSTGQNDVARARALLNVLAISLGVVVAAAAFVGTGYLDSLAGQTPLRAVVSLVVGLAAGVPLMGLPSLRAFALRHAHERRTQQLRAATEKFGYPTTKINSTTTEAELAGILDAALAEKVTKIRETTISALDDP